MVVVSVVYMFHEPKIGLALLTRRAKQVIRRGTTNRKKELHETATTLLSILKSFALYIERVIVNKPVCVNLPPTLRA